MLGRAMLRGMIVALVMTVVLASGADVYAQESAALAAELVELLDGADAIAAKDSEGIDRFVAALSFPGQLIVVSARYEVPMYVEEKIANGQYREVYLDLNGAALPDSKILITDIGADGLAGGGTDMVDTGSGPAIFEDDAETDAQYVRILRALIAGAR